MSKNKNILVTGGAGFIGSNFIPYFLDKYPNYSIINLDLLTYAGDLNNLLDIEKNERYKFINGDICNQDTVNSLFQNYEFSGVVHFAAESHVDNSIESPDVFIKTNIIGTFNLVHASYKLWMNSANKFKKEFAGSRFLHVSTDEVYGSLGDEGLFKETTPYAPNSPYSASKASSDMIIRSYHETYGMNTVITNCSNNYGPKQNEEKLIPKIISNAYNGKDIPIYGDGKNIRDWLYVLDHCKGIDLAFHNGKFGETYNIGGRNEKTNIEIVEEICNLLDKKIPKKTSYKDLITFVEDRAGHDQRYAIDASKIESDLGWKADENFQSGIEKTIEWYLKKLK